MGKEKANMAQGASRKNHCAIFILARLISSHTAAELAVISQSMGPSTSGCWLLTWQGDGGKSGQPQNNTLITINENVGF